MFPLEVDNSIMLNEHAQYTHYSYLEKNLYVLCGLFFKLIFLLFRDLFCRNTCFVLVRFVTCSDPDCALT